LIDSDTWYTYVFVSWLPTYLKQQYKFDLNSSGFYSLMPVLVKGIVAVTAGLLARKLTKSTSNLTRTPIVYLPRACKLTS